MTSALSSGSAYKPRDEGVILLLTLIVTMALTAMGMGVLLATDFDLLASANVREQLDTQASAEAALELGIARLAVIDDWTGIPGGAGLPLFHGGTTPPAAAGGQVVDLAALTSEAQQAAYGVGSLWGADTPRFVVAGYGVAADTLGPTRLLSERTYVLFWLSDDVSESDGNPSVDSNGVLVLRAHAFGGRRTQAIVQAVVEQTGTPGVVRRISWGRLP
jgi:hypothetical protein